MALHHVLILSIFLVVVVFLTTVQTKRINRQQLRPTRGFQDMELAVTRGFGKRAIDMHLINKQKPPPDNEWIGRQQRGEFQDMGLSVARNYGKRAVDMHAINNFLLEWFALETKMRSLRKAQERNNLSEMDE